MAFHEGYQKQVQPLVRALPGVAEEKDFALKGGTAINGEPAWTARDLARRVCRFPPGRDAARSALLRYSCLEIGPASMMGDILV